MPKTYTYRNTFTIELKLELSRQPVDVNKAMSLIVDLNADPNVRSTNTSQSLVYTIMTSPGRNLQQKEELIRKLINFGFEMGSDITMKSLLRDNPTGIDEAMMLIRLGADSNLMINGNSDTVLHCILSPKYQVDVKTKIALIRELVGKYRADIMQFRNVNSISPFDYYMKFSDSLEVGRVLLSLIPARDANDRGTIDWKKAYGFKWLHQWLIPHYLKSSTWTNKDIVTVREALEFLVDECGVDINQQVNGDSLVRALILEQIKILPAHELIKFHLAMALVRQGADPHGLLNALCKAINPSNSVIITAYIDELVVLHRSPLLLTNNRGENQFPADVVARFNSISTAENAIPEKTAILTSIMSRRFGIVDAMAVIRQGADPYIKAKSGDTILHVLALKMIDRNGNVNLHIVNLMRELVITHKMNIDCKDSAGLTVIEYVTNQSEFAKRYQVLQVFELLRLGANPNIYNQSGYSLLHRWIRNLIFKNGQVVTKDDIKLLVFDYHANTKIKSPEGLTPQKELDKHPALTFSLSRETPEREVQLARMAKPNAERTFILNIFLMLATAKVGESHTISCLPANIIARILSYVVHGSYGITEDDMYLFGRDILSRGQEAKAVLSKRSGFTVVQRFNRANQGHEYRFAPSLKVRILDYLNSKQKNEAAFIEEFPSHIDESLLAYTTLDGMIESLFRAQQEIVGDPNLDSIVLKISEKIKELLDKQSLERKARALIPDDRYPFVNHLIKLIMNPKSEACADDLLKLVNTINSLNSDDKEKLFNILNKWKEKITNIDCMSGLSVDQLSAYLQLKEYGVEKVDILTANAILSDRMVTLIRSMILTNNIPPQEAIAIAQTVDNKWDNYIIDGADIHQILTLNELQQDVLTTQYSYDNRSALNWTVQQLNQDLIKIASLPDDAIALVLNHGHSIDEANLGLSHAQLDILKKFQDRGMTAEILKKNPWFVTEQHQLALSFILSSATTSKTLFHGTIEEMLKYLQDRSSVEIELMLRPDGVGRAFYQYYVSRQNSDKELSVEHSTLIKTLTDSCNYTIDEAVAIVDFENRDQANSLIDLYSQGVSDDNLALAEDLQKYIERIRRSALTDMSKKSHEYSIDFKFGFRFFRDSQAVNRQANYQLACELRDGLLARENIATLFSRTNISKIRNQFKHTLGINSAELNAVINKARNMR